MSPPPSAGSWQSSAAARRKAPRLIFGRSVPVFLISIEKVLSSVAVASTALVALYFHSRGITNPVPRVFARELAEDPHDIVVNWLMVHIPHLRPGQTVLAGLGLLAFALLLVAEGIGFWLGLGWAEWLVVLETGALVPVELWNLITKPYLSGAVILTVNMLVLVYILFRRRRLPSHDRA